MGTCVGSVSAVGRVSQQSLPSLLATRVLQTLTWTLCMFSDLYSEPRFSVEGSFRYLNTHESSLVARNSLCRCSRILQAQTWAFLTLPLPCLMAVIDSWLEEAHRFDSLSVLPPREHKSQKRLESNSSICSFSELEAERALWPGGLSFCVFSGYGYWCECFVRGGEPFICHVNIYVCRFSY